MSEEVKGDGLVVGIGGGNGNILDPDEIAVNVFNVHFLFYRGPFAVVQLEFQPQPIPDADLRFAQGFEPQAATGDIHHRYGFDDFAQMVGVVNRGIGAGKLGRFAVIFAFFKVDAVMVPAMTAHLDSGSPLDVCKPVGVHRFGHMTARTGEGQRFFSSDEYLVNH
jgi:hypothetical protein